MKTDLWLSAAAMLLAAGIIGAPAADAQTVGDYGDYSNETLIQDVSWWYDGEFIVGDVGTNNLLVVTNDITFRTGHTVVGVEGGHNRVLVTDDARFWFERSPGWHAYLGSNSSHNVMIVTNRGQALGEAELHLGGNSGADSNRVVVTGSGSEMLQLRLSVGWDGDYNSVLVEDGARLYSRGADPNIQLGRGSGSHNTLTVTGGDSSLEILDASGSRYINVGGGAGASSNVLTITDGAAADIAGYIRVGNSSGASYNRLVVNEEGYLRIQGEGQSAVGRQGADNRMVIDGAGSLVEVDDNVFFIGEISGATGNELAIYTGGVMRISGERELRMGHNVGADSNRLVVSGGDARLELLVDGWSFFGGSGHYNETLIEDGGVITNSGDRTIMGGQHNRMVIDGAGSKFQGQQLYMDGTDNNRIVVTNGGRFEMTGFMSVGFNVHNQNNKILVSGDDSLVVGGTSMRLGGNGTHNLLRIEDGGRLEVTSARIGEGAPGAGMTATGSWNRAEVSGMGSELAIGGGLEIGRHGSHNSLAVDNLGRVQIGGDLEIGADATSASNIVTVSDAELEVTGNIHISPAGDAGNRLEIHEWANVTAADTIVGTNGTLFLAGGDMGGNVTLQQDALLAGDGEIYGAVDSAGVIAPGQSAGSLQFWSALTLQDTSVLDMEIGGTDDSEYDRIIGTGFTMTLDGTLKVSFIDGFSPADGDTFTLFENWDLAGEFSDYDLQDPGAGLAWDTTGIESDGTLTVIPEPASALFLALGGAILVYLRRRR